MKSVIRGVVVPLAAFAVLSAGVLGTSATDAGKPHPSTTAGVLLLSDSVKPSGKPKPPHLAEEEKQAIENKKAGRPYKTAVFNEAMKKQVEGEKYNKKRNKQKRGK